MTEELVKLLVGTGVGGVIGVLAILEIRSMRRELRESLANLPAWLQAIHSRLSGLGADSIEPPIPPDPLPRRRHRGPPKVRIQTAPVGWPTSAAAPADSEDQD